MSAKPNGATYRIATNARLFPPLLLSRKAKTMKKRTHTPGPWTWAVGDEVVSAEDGLTYVAWLPTSKAARRSKVVKNDAHLIAAAPELLEALRAYVAACHEQDIRLGPITGDAKRAIAKASGEAS